MRTRSRSIPTRPPLAVGDRIALLPHCPIDFEGVGPLPGTEGEVVGLPAVQDFRRCVAVRFDGLACEWLIPSSWLGRQRSTTFRHGR